MRTSWDSLLATHPDLLDQAMYGDILRKWEHNAKKEPFRGIRRVYKSVQYRLDMKLAVTLKAKVFTAHTDGFVLRRVLVEHLCLCSSECGPLAGVGLLAAIGVLTVRPSCSRLLQIHTDRVASYSVQGVVLTRGGVIVQFLHLVVLRCLVLRGLVTNALCCPLFFLVDILMNRCFGGFCVTCAKIFWCARRCHLCLQTLRCQFTRASSVNIQYDPLSVFCRCTRGQDIHFRRNGEALIGTANAEES